MLVGVLQKLHPLFLQDLAVGLRPVSGVRVLEVSLGTFDEADIERLQDDYGRS